MNALHALDGRRWRPAHKSRGLFFIQGIFSPLFFSALVCQNLMKRVVSLLPSATEALCVIPGGQALLVGRSHECDFPNQESSTSWFCFPFMFKNSPCMREKWIISPCPFNPLCPHSIPFQIKKRENLRLQIWVLIECRALRGLAEREICLSTKELFLKTSELFYQILQSEADNEHNLWKMPQFSSFSGWLIFPTVSKISPLDI